MNGTWNNMNGRWPALLRMILNVRPNRDIINMRDGNEHSVINLCVRGIKMYCQAKIWAWLQSVLPSSYSGNAIHDLRIGGFRLNSGWTFLPCIFAIYSPHRRIATFVFVYTRWRSSNTGIPTPAVKQACYLAELIVISNKFCSFHCSAVRNQRYPYFCRST